IRDITDRKRTEAQLSRNAFYDPLTGLPNRALFMDRLGHAVERAHRRGNDSKKRETDVTPCFAYMFAVLFLDLDRFKVVNDSLGHMMGDQLLVAIAARLEACLRPGDTVARLGGDEFTILLDNIQDISDAIAVAERVHKELALPFTLSGHEVFTTVSIGIALSSTAASYDQPECFLRDADTAMYRAKALGKARHAVFDIGMRVQAVSLLQLETNLRRALSRQEFCLHYQPIVSLGTGKTVGFEALIRWQHPSRGLISPTEFIPVAEETGLIVPIGWWVLQEACRQLRQWQTAFPLDPPLTISVNLSGKQFLQPDLLPQISQVLRDTALNAESLKLEITESVISPENSESATNI
ncbi:MAG TPA: diguanylate cyclase, partial [Candidatus Caenarcaniphilales bacterium]